jgi:hypothetical protein
MTNLNLTDMETCYKMFRSDTMQGLILTEKRFGFEPEVTAKIAKRRESASMRWVSVIMAERLKRARRLGGRMDLGLFIVF